MAAIAAVERRFAEMVQVLRDQGIPYSTIGNQATSLWIATVDESATRNARDTELLIQRQDLDRVMESARSIGLMHEDRNGYLTLFPTDDRSTRNVIRLLFAGETRREADALPAPLLDQIVVLRENIPVLPLALHLQTQLVWYRLDDRVDLIDMMRVGLIGDESPFALPKILAERLRETYKQFRIETEGIEGH